MKSNVYDYLLDEKHLKRFLEIVEIAPQFEDDKNYTPAGYLLTATQNIFTKVKKYITDAVIRDNKGRPPEYIYNDRQNKLCTWRTWKKIASGKISPNDDLYDFLMKKTGNVWIEMQESDKKKLNTKLSQLLHIAEQGNFTEMANPCVEIINLISPYKNEFYYNDLYNAVLNIQKTFVNEEYIETTYFDLYMRILDCFSSAVQALLKNAMFQYAAYFSGDISLIEKVVLKYDFKHSECFLRIKYGQLLMYQENYIAAYHVFTELEELYADQKITHIFLKYVM